jgi:hypothetical protein
LNDWNNGKAVADGSVHLALGNMVPALLSILLMVVGWLMLVFPLAKL